MTLAWHFVGDSLRGGRPVPPNGVTLIHNGPVIPCKYGLHASRHPFDALRYAPGGTLCLVRCGGQIVSHGDPEDKIACSERTILARMDFTEPLRYFARMQAMSVVHLWDAPDVVLDYLLTGDPKLQAAALAAARDAAWAAELDAALAAAWAAAEAAAWAAAEAAAWAAAWAAALAATSDAMLAATGGKACAAARDVVRLDFANLVHECFEKPLMDAQ